MAPPYLKYAGLSVLVTWIMMLLLSDRSRAATTQSSSTGCNNINDPLFDTAYENGDAGFFPFFAGEQMVVAASPPANGSPELVSLSVNGDLVASAAFPATLTLIIPADGSYDISWGVKNGDATWSIDCDHPASSTPTHTKTSSPTGTPRKTATSTPTSTTTPTRMPTGTPTVVLVTSTATPTNMPPHTDVHLPFVVH